MFTGLIQQICMVKAVRRSGGTASLAVDLQDLAKQTKVGDSIAINGVCLTVSKLAGTLVTFDISSETLAKTNIGNLTGGSKVNVELAMTPTDRFGGHFVLGHVDGTATIRRIEKRGDFATFTFAANKDLLDQMIPKGSVAVDGISLTIVELTEEGFAVAVIPKTLKKTTLGLAKTGDTVNIETDIITKTVRKQVEAILPRGNKLTVDKLQELGF
jgi:riboflavin synthase